MSGVEGLKEASDGLLAALFECQDKLWVGRCDSRDVGFRVAAERAVSMADDARDKYRAALSAIEGGGGALQPSASVPTEPVADRWADLKRLAKEAACVEKGWRNAGAEHRFGIAANPAAILELIAAARRDEGAGQ